MRPATVTGLAAEAHIARRAGLPAMAGGGAAKRTVAIAESLLAKGAGGLISFGIAGGLDPALRPGTLLLPRRICTDEGRMFAVAADWQADLLASFRRLGLSPSESDLLGTAGVVASASAKAAAFRRTGAGAVDLESHIVAEVAERAGLPFMAIRVVADSAARSLPPAALIELTATGRPALRRVLASVLRDPRQIGALLRVAGDTRRALRTLGYGATVLRHSFGPDAAAIETAPARIAV